MSQSRTIAVTGATGFVGRSLVRELVSRGHRVRALVRDARKAKQVLPVGDRLELVTGAVHDGVSPASLLKRCDTCIHLIGIIREVRGSKHGEEPQTFERMHVGATRIILEACLAAGVERYVQMSSLGADPDGKAAYQRTKYQAEELVRASGLNWTIFRPSFIHGAGSELVAMIHDMASGQIAPWYFMPYFAREVVDQSVPLGPSHFESARIQPVSIYDVVECFAECLDRPVAIGEIYNLTGRDTLTWPELYKFYSRILPGANPDMPIAGLPGQIAAIGAAVAGKLGMGGLLPFDAGQALMSIEDSTAELHKVKAHLGHTPRRFRETAEMYAGELARAH
ncbi:MAG: NAD(P)H-binding protein [Pyrinomonadaceae bacterium]|nr:NAD(P)H-binding protein [Phycisphaerales bacterium]